MKKIFFIVAFLFSAFVSFSQVIPKPNPTAVGIGYKRLLADSTIFIPTGGTIPRLGANNINRRSAIYADTINKKLYVFYPNDSTWKESGTDTASLSARIDARVKYADTSSMLAPYLRTANSHGVPSGGTSGQLLSKNSDSDYDLVWIDNYADWTSLIKQQYKATESITKGQAVYISGADGTNALISKASNASEITSSKTIGLLAQTLSTNGKGFVVTEGLLGGLNTATAIAGDPVWLGTNGDLIFGYLNKPHAPAHLVYLGVVTRANGSNGEILIKPQNGFEVKELHDVSAQSPSNNDGLFYNNSNSLWETKSIATALGYTPANDANIVHITGTEAITGAKTFSNTSTFTGTSVFNNQATFNDIAKINAEIKWIKNPAIQTASGGYLTTYATSGFGLSFFDGDSGNESKFNFNGSGIYTYTYPASSGTLALTSDITTGYVPYTGATADVDLGNHNLSTNYALTAKSQVNAGAVYVDGKPTWNEGDMLAFAQYPSTTGGTYKKTALSVSNNNTLHITYWHDSTSGGFLRYKQVALKTDSLNVSTPRNYFWPNADGVLALKGDIPSLANYVTLDGAQTITGAKTFSASVNNDNGLKIKFGSASNLTAGYLTLSAYAETTPLPDRTILRIGTAAAQMSLLYFQNTGSYQYTFPNASGTIALTSDIPSLANYVTLTGAQTISGNKTFSGTSLFTGSATFSSAVQASTGILFPNNGVVSNGAGVIGLGGVTSGLRVMVNGTGFTSDLVFNSGANYTYTYPSASGTIALTSDLTTGYVPYTGATGPVNFGYYDLMVSGVRVGAGPGTGSNNTRVGALSYMSNTTGGYNTAIGTLAMYANTTGSGNTSLGNSSLTSNTTGISNTAIGETALANVTTGGANIGVGRSSGGNITTGSYNTIIGNYGGSPTLASNVILSDGQGNIRYQFDGSANNFTSQTNIITTPTFSSNGNIASYNNLNLTVPGGSTFNNGGTWTGSNNSNIVTWNGSNTIASGAIMTGFAAVNRHSFGAAGYTETFSGGSGGIRASAGFQVLQQTGGSFAGTISHGASMFVQGVYPSTAANITYTNYYGLLMNNLDEWGGVTFTNRWGIYQAGASDNNYFAGKVNIGSNTVTSDALNVTGTSKFSSSITASGRVNIVNTGYGWLHTTNSTYDQYLLSQSLTNGFLITTGKNGAFTIPYLALGVNDGETIRINNAGNVGIGTASPGFTLDVNSGTAGSTASFNSNRTGGGGIILMNNSAARTYIGNANWMGISGEATTSTAISIASAENSDIIFATNAAYSVAERMRITASGAVKLSTLYASSRLYAQSSSSTLELGLNGTNPYVQAYLTSGAANTNLDFYTGTSFAARISSNQNLIVGTTTDVGGGWRFQVNGNVYFSKTTPILRIDGTGSGNSGANIQLLGWASANPNWQISTAMYTGGLELSVSTTAGGSTFSSVIGTFNSSTGIYVPVSDSSKKKDFEISTIGLNAILGLKPTLYRMKTDKENSPKTLGFIAQEVKPFIPQAYVEEGNFIGLQDRPIIAALVKAVQELESRIKILENK